MRRLVSSFTSFPGVYGNRSSAGKVKWKESESIPLSIRYKLLLIIMGDGTPYPVFYACSVFTGGFTGC